MDLLQITPVVLTYNEEANIARTLAQLTWAREVIVVDSFSTDETITLVRSFPNTRLFQRKFDNHTSQWNYGLDQAKTNWILSLDADYFLTDLLLQELATRNFPADVAGCSISFLYCIEGIPLRGTVLPPRIALFRLGRAHYVQDGHTQHLQLDGRLESLQHPIHHDDRKPLSRWLLSQDRYMPLEVDKLFSGVPLSLTDRIRKTVFFAPWLMFFYCLVVKRGLFDGYRGWYYAYQRMLAETLLSLRILERHLRQLPDK